MVNITKEQLLKIRKKLPYRYSKEIATRAGCNPRTVLAVINGERDDHFGILKEAALWIAEIEKQTREILKNAKIQ